MVAWESNPTAGFLIADMGAYLGSDWPPVAPPLTGMFPADAGEIDYYVLDPAVDDYRTMGFSPSGTAWSDSYAYMGGSLHFGAYTDGSSSGPPSGAHIYVAWYDTSYSTAPGAPSVTPESLIPSSYSAVGELPPPPPPTPTIYGVYGNLPGRGLSSDVLAVGYPVIISGADLATVDKVQLPGLTMLAADFTSQNASAIAFVLPTTSGILGGPMRVSIGTNYDEQTVDVLRPETGWRTPDPVSVVGITTQVNTNTSPASAGRFKTVGSSRSGDGGTPTYNDDSYPPEKMGYDNGTILEQVTVLGIDGGFFYTGMNADGFGVIPSRANIDGTLPPTPSGAPSNWVFEYQDQPSGSEFSTQSPVRIKDALTEPIRTYVALQPTYTDPRLSDTGFEIFALPADEVTVTEVTGAPDSHLTKMHSWFTSDKLIDSALGPNFHGGWGDGFDPTPDPGWVAVSTSLSSSSGFDGTGMKATGAGEFRSPPIGATPRFAYYMFCWVGNAPAAGGTVQVGIAWLDVFGTEISIDWGSPHSVPNSTGGLDNFENLTLVSANAPDNPAVWSRQLVFQFSGCASLEIDDVNFQYDAGLSGSYYPIRELTFPGAALYQDPTVDRLFITLIGATGPGIVGTAETGKLAYAMTGSSPTVETGDFHLYVTYQPTPWRYWLPAATGTLPSTTASWQVGSVAW